MDDLYLTSSSTSYFSDDIWVETIYSFSHVRDDKISALFAGPFVNCRERRFQYAYMTLDFLSVGYAKHGGPTLSLHGNSAGCHFSLASKLDTVSSQIAVLSLALATIFGNVTIQGPWVRVLFQSTGILIYQSAQSCRRLTRGGRSHAKSILGVGY